MPARPEKILIIHSGGIGDLLTALPAMRIFRQAFPHCTLEVMGRPERLALVAFDLRARAIHSIDQSEMAYFYLQGECLPPRLSAFFSSFGRILLFARSKGEILGENLIKAGAGPVLNIPSFPEEGGSVPVSEYLLEGMRSAGFTGENAFTPLSLPADALAFAENFWKQKGWVEETKVLGIHPGSGRPLKNWHPRNFSRVANAFHNRAKVLLISGPAQDGGEEVRRRMEKRPLIADQLPLLQLAAVLKASTAFLGNDSGITHLAAALGIPTVAIFGPTDPAVWAPRGPKVKIFCGENSCWPCSTENRSRCFRQCLENIKPDWVIKSLASFLQ